METYRIEELNFTFPLQESKTLSHINLTIQSGEFVAICGKSGSGKSTLLRQLKSILAPHGEPSGRILFCGQPLEEVDPRTQAAQIGFVLQNPDNQIVTDKVWHELAFGLENLGFDQRTIRLRVAEMASFFGIQSWFHRDVSELSGGQKQLLNLASIMAMHPAVLILDEPTSQLDPIAAAEFLAALTKINRELGTTIIMTEHRLEEVLPITDRLILMDEGAVLADAPPAQAGEALFRMQHPMSASMPSPMQIYAEVDGASASAYPVTVKEGRQWLNDFLSSRTAAPDTMAGDCPQLSSRTAAPDTAAGEPPQSSKQVAITFKDVWFKYDKHGPDVLKDLSLEIREGQFYCVVGGNGTGKTTALSLISGIRQPYRGKVLIGGKNPAKMKANELFINHLGVLPQNPQTLFVKKTVEQDLHDMLADTALSKEEKSAKVAAIVQFAELEHLLSMHPYDLSGGEQQRAALAKVLLLEPRILLLDEPTKGLDGFFKEKLAAFLKKLNDSGVTIVMISHDIEFCARHGEVCALFFDGGIIASDSAGRFFSGNSFYTTAANRMVRHVWSGGITIEDVIERCQTSS
ncbi:Putative HMP/thiamine import ATP-binding protein YkoD [Paenibacillus plantiphilus]|uniref:HMP/thiamine import ATP-binding protein YkoD n=1 Tax=Paenibacillus plantiphilus TaxID=2905650 RepID=A0ABM9C3R2_9BACL|nr:ATP-binding cassette domain-containing protein [Paenibacillus plantiphilus]CAH1200593.1 Putative HMP/thiamine import ATP-binding protein YkoD [Paenibacillus plantiphilus]